MLSRSLFSCRVCPPSRIFTGFTPCVQSMRLLRIDSYSRISAPFKAPWSSDQNRDPVRKRISKFRITMSEEEKDRKLQAIENSKREDKPQGLVAKLKFYIKRYWYIAIPVHMINCSIWFTIIYLAVRSGIDVIWLLETLHMPNVIIEKIKNTPASAGFIVVSLLLYKIATPIRYATTLAAIRLSFGVLRKFGWLRTARELEFKLRNKYEVLNKRRLSGASQLLEREKDKLVKRVGKSTKSK